MFHWVRFIRLIAPMEPSIKNFLNEFQDLFEVFYWYLLDAVLWDDLYLSFLLDLFATYFGHFECLNADCVCKSLRLC